MKRLTVLTLMALVGLIVGWYVTSDGALAAGDPVVPCERVGLGEAGYLAFRAAPGGRSCSALPHGGVWKIHWDLTLDGRVEGGTIRPFRLDLANNQIRARFAGEYSQHNTQDRWWHGEVVPGRTPVIVLRRDDVGGYAASNLLRQTEPGHFLGTWVDNLGHAGDIQLSLQGDGKN